MAASIGILARRVESVRIRLTRAVLIAALMLLLVAAPALAEGHHCRTWYPDPYYGGYWLYPTCEGGRWSPSGWFPELPNYEWSNPYLDIQPPYYY